MESVPSFSIVIMSSSSALTPYKVPVVRRELARTVRLQAATALSSSPSVCRSPWSTLGRKGFIQLRKKGETQAKLARLEGWCHDNLLQQKRIHSRLLTQVL